MTHTMKANKADHMRKKIDQNYPNLIIQIRTMKCSNHKKIQVNILIMDQRNHSNHHSLVIEKWLLGDGSGLIQ